MSPREGSLNDFQMVFNCFSTSLLIYIRRGNLSIPLSLSLPLSFLYYMNSHTHTLLIVAAVIVVNIFSFKSSLFEQLWMIGKKLINTIFINIHIIVMIVRVYTYNNIKKYLNKLIEQKCNLFTAIFCVT